MSTLASVIGRGLLSARPAASIAGELYYATDTDILYRDTGAAWAAVSMGGGSSFPGAPATNDRFFRNDRIIEYMYDGTRWLCTCPHELRFGTGDSSLSVSGNTTIGRAPVWYNDYDLWLQTYYCFTDVITTNNGSNFWTARIDKAPAGTTITSVTTASDTAGTMTGHKATVGALLGTSQTELEFTVIKTGSPGVIYAGGFLAYRLVG